MAEAMLSPYFFLKGNKMYRSKYTQNIIQAIAWIGTVILLLVGVGLMNGCSQEMGTRLEITWPEEGDVEVTYTDFKFNYFFYDRDWKNFKYGELVFDELDGESKSVDVDLLRQRGSVK